jgi:hypothetical protein
MRRLPGPTPRSRATPDGHTCHCRFGHPRSAVGAEVEQWRTSSQVWPTRQLRREPEGPTGTLTFLRRIADGTFVALSAPPSLARPFYSMDV